MNKKKIILVVFFHFLTFSNSFSIDADVFVQSTVNRASKILSENLSKDEKINKLKIIFLVFILISFIELSLPNHYHLGY